MPISCGVYTIAVLIILLTILVFCEIFFQLEDDDPYWYVIVALCCLGPAIVGAVFCVMFIMRNRNWTRILMVWATILFLISIVLVVSWDAVYYIFLDRHMHVSVGTQKVGGKWGEYDSSRKVMTFYIVLFGIIVTAIFAYFICVTVSYKTALENDDDDESTESEESEKKEEDMMGEDMKMDDAMAMDMM